MVIGLNDNINIDLKCLRKGVACWLPTTHVEKQVSKYRVPRTQGDIQQVPALALSLPFGVQQ